MARLAMSQKAEKEVMAKLAAPSIAPPFPAAKAPAAEASGKQAGASSPSPVAMLAPLNDRMRADLDEISGRANSLLTHISIMIAVISAFLFYSQTQADRSMIVMVLFGELVGYILTALACLGAIGLQPVIEYGQEASEREFRKLSGMSRNRSSLYTLSYFSALLLTALFLVTLLVDLDVISTAQGLLSTLFSQ